MTPTRRPICFVATTHPDAARAFYGGVLGLELTEASPYALVYSDAGVMLRIQIVTQLHPPPHTVHGWDVADIKSEIAELTSKGVAFLTFDALGQDPDGVWHTPDGHKIAWFKDPSGNILSLTEFVPSLSSCP